MNLTGIMRISYLLGWVFAVLAVVYRGLQMLGIQALNRVGVTSRGVLFFSGFLFLVTVATAAYAQTQGSTTVKGRSAAA